MTGRGRWPRARHAKSASVPESVFASASENGLESELESGLESGLESESESSVLARR